MQFENYKRDMHYLVKTFKGQNALKASNVARRISSDEELLKLFYDAINRMTPETNLHKGPQAYKEKAVPESLVIFCWLLKYGITDEKSYEIFMKWVTATKSPKPQRSKDGLVNEWNPSWLKKHVIIPTYVIVEDIFLSQNHTMRSKISAIFCKEASHFSHISARLRHLLTATIVQCMIAGLQENGADPVPTAQSRSESLLKQYSSPDENHIALSEILFDHLPTLVVESIISRGARIFAKNLQVTSRNWSTDYNPRDFCPRISMKVSQKGQAFMSPYKAYRMMISGEVTFKSMEPHDRKKILKRIAGEDAVEEGAKKKKAKISDADCNTGKSTKDKTRQAKVNVNFENKSALLKYIQTKVTRGMNDIIESVPLDYRKYEFFGEMRKLPVWLNMSNMFRQLEEDDFIWKEDAYDSNNDEETPSKKSDSNSSRP